jgi:hypothetical protein
MTRHVKGKRNLVSKPRAKRRPPSSVAEAIFQLQKWVSGSAQIKLILARSTHTIHHNGRILSEVSEVFHFVSDSGMEVWLTPSEWVHVSLEHTPHLLDSIHVETTGSNEVELTLSHWHREEDRLARAEAFEQLVQWVKGETAVLYGSGNKISRNVLAGRLVGPLENGIFMIKGLDGQAYGQLDPNEATHVVLRREERSVGVFLYFACDIAYVLQTDETLDPLVAMSSLSKMIQ